MAKVNDGVASPLLLTAWGSRLHIASLLIILFTGLYCCSQTLKITQEKESFRLSPSWTGVAPGASRPGEQICDVDTRLIHNGLLEAPRFSDTARWWTGTWVGKVPFYRPLTSLLFWAEWKLWGDDERSYNLLATLLHLWAVWEFARLADALFRRFHVPCAAAATLIAGLAFVTGVLVLASEDAITAEVYTLWKNQPDAMTLALFCWTLRTYLGQDQSRWRPAVSLLLYLLVCLTKEAGVFLPLLLPLVEAEALLGGDKTKRQAAARRILPFFVLLLLYLCLRGLFLHNMIGYTYGSNGAWGARLGANVACTLSRAALGQRYHPIALALFLWGGFALARYFHKRQKNGRLAPSLVNRPFWFLVCLLGGVSLLAGLGAVLNFLDGGDLDPAVGLLRFLEASVIGETFAILVFSVAVVTTAVRRPYLTAFAYAWALLALGLTLFSPSVLHRYYLVNAGFALLIGAGATFWIYLIQGYFTKRIAEASR